MIVLLQNAISFVRINNRVSYIASNDKNPINCSGDRGWLRRHQPPWSHHCSSRRRENTTSLQTPTAITLYVYSIIANRNLVLWNSCVERKNTANYTPRKYCLGCKLANMEARSQRVSWYDRWKRVLRQYLLFQLVDASDAGIITSAHYGILTNGYQVGFRSVQKSITNVFQNRLLYL